MADGTPPPRPLVILLCVSLLFTLTPVTADPSEPDPENGSGDTDPVLHLRGESPQSGSYRNFTAAPPNATDPFQVAPCSVATQGSAQWCWQMNRAPEPWTLQAGASVEAIIHLSHLERVPLGLMDPEEPQRISEVQVRAVLTRGTNHEVAHGTTHLPAPLLADIDTAEVHISLEVPEDVHWNTEPGDAPAVELQIHLDGLIRRDEPPMITTGTPETDSRLILPGFPLERFQHWETEEAQQRTCQQLILAQKPCNEPGTDEPPSEPIIEEAPLPGPILLLILVTAGLALVRRRPTRTLA